MCPCGIGGDGAVAGRMPGQAGSSLEGNRRTAPAIALRDCFADTRKPAGPIYLRRMAGGRCREKKKEIWICTLIDHKVRYTISILLRGCLVGISWSKNTIVSFLQTCSVRGNELKSYNE